MIGFAGLSHLGISYSLATAAKGFEVVAFHSSAGLVADLGRGKFPIEEPGLAELFTANQKRILFTASAADLSACELVFVSLDVKTDDANRSDTTPLCELLRQITPHLPKGCTLVLLSQVNPGFTRKLCENFLPQSLAVKVFYQVETLIFGRAVERALHPERYMVGAADPDQPLPELFRRWHASFGCPVLVMRYESAELAKIAINLFLVSTVSTTNTLSELCEKIGADWSEIAPALRLDKRIGPHAYLSPGLGIAGGNLERDLMTVKQLAGEHGCEAGVIEAWLLNSRYSRDWVLRKIHALVLANKEDPTLVLWGLAYKPNTHSTKNSPALALIDALAAFTKMAYDPQATLDAKTYPRLRLASSPLEACRGGDALVVMTPWPEFAKIEPAEIQESMKGNVLIDPFGALNETACVEAGLAYHRLGVSIGECVL